MNGTIADTTVKVVIWLPLLLLCAAIEQAALDNRQ